MDSQLISVCLFFPLCLYFCMPQRQRELLGYKQTCRAGFFSLRALRGRPESGFDFRKVLLLFLQPVREGASEGED